MEYRTKKEINRINHLAIPEHFMVNIQADNDVGQKLTEQQYKRLEYKLRIVENIAQELAARMLKGTLKYNTDDHSPAEWFSMMQDDQFDTINYTGLLKNKMKKGDE